MKCYVGTSGWSYNHWKDIFYPQKLAHDKWLGFYAERFNTVEINMTFYRDPTVASLTRWFASTPDDFAFTLKIPRIITHVKRLHDIDSYLQDFYALVEPLRFKLKCLLFQLPPSFHLSHENTERIIRLNGLLDHRYDHAIEFRHPSWWCNQTKNILTDKIAFCSVNGLDMPENIIITGGIAYLRFHGMDYGTLYSEDILRRYADELYSMADRRIIRKIYIYFNNDFLGYALTNAMMMTEMLEKKLSHT